MVAGLAFLSKKGFNPANRSNQKTVWEAQQQKEHEVKRAKEREDQLRRERDDEELARAREGERGGNQATLRFMYAPPPGLAGPSDAGEASNGATTTANMTDVPNDDNTATMTDVPNDDNTANTASLTTTTTRQPGDDDAAAAFRQMLAAAATNTSAQESTISESSQASGMHNTSSGAALTGTTIEKTSDKKQTLSALEKAVGRKDANSSLTLEEQIARFPQLRNAPMAKGMNATNVNVAFKPLGTQLRNVRCMACGVWGHTRGDRECAKSGWDPFSSRPITTPNTSAADAEQGREGAMKRDDVRATSAEETRKRERDDSSDNSGDDSRRRRRKHHKKSRRHKHESKRRSKSPERHKSRKHKKSRKHSRHD